MPLLEMKSDLSKVQNSLKGGNNLKTAAEYIMELS